MTALPIGLAHQQDPIPRMNDDGFLDDETAPMKTGDIPTRVVKRYIVDIVRVKPDLALSKF